MHTPGPVVDWVSEAMRGRVVNIGQLDKPTINALNAAVKRGQLIKSRGFWNTPGPVGIGPLKTVWSAAN